MAHERPLVVITDETLLDEVLRLAAAVGCELQRAPDTFSARAEWSRAPLILVDEQSLDHALPPRPGLLLVTKGTPEAPIWQRAFDAGVEAVVPLPDREAALVGVLADVAEGPTVPGGCVIAVVGGRGGAGASVFAAALALTAATERRPRAATDDSDRAQTGAADPAQSATTADLSRSANAADLALSAGLAGRAQPAIAAGHAPVVGTVAPALSASTAIGALLANAAGVRSTARNPVRLATGESDLAVSTTAAKDHARVTTGVGDHSAASTSANGGTQARPALEGGRANPSEGHGGALLIDCDPLGAGLDMTLGAESADGARWPALRLDGGRISMSTLRDALPKYQHRGWRLPFLSCDDTGAGPTGAAVASVVDAASRAGATVICDLPRHLGPAAEAVLARADLIVMVVPAEVRACASARRVAAHLKGVLPFVADTATEIAGGRPTADVQNPRTSPATDTRRATPRLARTQLGRLRRQTHNYTDRLYLVVRGPAPGGLTPQEVAQAVQIPLLTSMAPDRALAKALDNGDFFPRRRGPLATAARLTLASARARAHRSEATA